MTATPSAREILSDVYFNVDDAKIVSYRDPYGEDNAVQVGDRIAVLGDGEPDDENQQVFMWTGYSAENGEIIWDSQAGYADDARAAIASWLAQGNK